MNKAGQLAAEILQTITDRYVITERTIPRDILKAKDEVMQIYSKALHETDPYALERYTRRLEEIKAAVV